MKKKKIIILLLVVVISIVALSTVAFAREQAETWICTGNGVNVRTGPDSSSPSYGYLYEGESGYSRPVADSYGAYHFCRCPMRSTSISQAYGYEIKGYVHGKYLMWPL